MMNTPELAVQLEECLRLAGSNLDAGDKEAFMRTRGTFSVELLTLLHEAKDMRWPFVEEKWQYKHSVASEDKVNTMELISKHLPQLMNFLRAAITACEPDWAMSVIFLLDRFLYWVDGSHTLLKMAKALHKRYPDTPIAPQIVIRQARVYLNTGKLQKAEFILSSLINNCGSTGCWRYQRDSDRILVQAVSVQVRGQVLQKLGLWLEAAELIWASLIGFYVLPLPDKKGIGMSLGLLANILTSMNNEDFATFQKKPHINLGFLEDCRHRLLCAAQAAKLATVYSQFSSLYALTHMVTRGTCLLSYSLSKDCPTADKHTYLTLAVEAFENGLLTKKDGDVVTSQQELHTLLRDAHCLAVANKWTYGLSDEVRVALQSCQEAMALFYSYCFVSDCDINRLASEMMARVQRVKSVLKVKPFANSDPRSFIPDSYRAMVDRPVPFTVSDFTKVMEGFRRHHVTVCEAYSAQKCKGGATDASHTYCITAFQTLTESLRTEAQALSMKSNKQQAALGTPDATPESEEQPRQNERVAGTSQRSSSLGSSWLNISGHSGSSPVMVDPFCCTEQDEGEPQGVNCEKGEYRESNQVTKDQPELVGKAAEAHQRSWQELCTTVGSEDGDNHRQTSTDFSFVAHQDRIVNKGEEVQHQQPELCTTMGSEDVLPVTNKTHASGSDSSSLGSSWQSVSFPKSLQIREGSVDQSCETAETEDSPFECVDLSLIPKGGPVQASDVSETKIGQGCLKNQSDIETEDPELLLFSHHISGLALVDANKSQTTNHQEASLRQLELMTSGDLDLYEVVQAVQSKANQEDEDEKVSHKEQDNRPLPKAPKMPEDAGQRLSRSPSVSSCSSCFQGCEMGSISLKEQDFRCLLSGVCHGCLLRRLPTKPFQLSQYSRAYHALVLKYSKSTDSWTACESGVYVGEVLDVSFKGGQRQVFRVQYLHQELLGSYVGKEYLEEKTIQAPLEDVERQMTAQFYVMEFNKRLYENNITTQIFYIPSEILLLLENDSITACVSVEPYMLGKFVKLTNNTTKVNKHLSTTEYALAFGHFTYEFSNREEVVVDLQGWMTANGKGLMYLTDPQIHTVRKPRCSNNFHLSGIMKFLNDQHGEDCNSICRAALRTHTRAHTHTPGQKSWT